MFFLRVSGFLVCINRHEQDILRVLRTQGHVPTNYVIHQQNIEKNAKIHKIQLAHNHLFNQVISPL